MDMTITQAPALASGWSQSASCLPTKDIWYWEWNRWYSSHSGGHAGGADLVEMLGAPTDLSSCYPPSYTPFGHMLGTACPNGFTSACNKDGITTCCPTAYDFTCHDGRISTYANISCSSKFENTTVLIKTAFLTETVDGKPVETESAERHGVTSGRDVLFALGVAYANPSTATLPSSTSTKTDSVGSRTSSTTSDSNTSITSGASESTASTDATAESTSSLASTVTPRGIRMAAVLVAGLAIIFGQ
ncbi:unnamed protein product [Clonostachys rosea]|uniref:Osmotin, thaumatin-like protein n=1 Tax=Bionectria ochroleuca TaxID=29856 RepID=A0ABY6U0F4_BIOOC|nr:unnamed protein product [Clonostachys rosea]